MVVLVEDDLVETGRDEEGVEEGQEDMRASCQRLLQVSK